MFCTRILRLKCLCIFILLFAVAIIDQDKVFKTLILYPKIQIALEIPRAKIEAKNSKYISIEKVTPCLLKVRTFKSFYEASEVPTYLGFSVSQIALKLNNISYKL